MQHTYTGSVEMLSYLKQQGCEFNAQTMEIAAGCGCLALCQYLVAEQCPCDAEACKRAAAGGFLEIVRLLHESGCPWEADDMCERAAGSGNIELLQYLKQEGCVFGEGAMSSAACRGLTHICQFLRAEQCPWDANASANAAHDGHVDTLRWLHEQGCPWVPHANRMVAAKGDHLPVLVYLQAFAPAASAAQLTEMLAAAGAYHKLAVVKWLRQQGAEWPKVLGYEMMCWDNECVQWAADQGGTSPSPWGMTKEGKTSLHH
jgi:hypothetical protein